MDDKWNLFKNNILDAEPEEGMENNPDGYGVPREASAEDLYGMKDADATKDSTTPSSDGNTADSLATEGSVSDAAPADAGTVAAGSEGGVADAGSAADPADTGSAAGAAGAGSAADPADTGSAARAADAGSAADPADTGSAADPVNTGFVAGAADAGSAAGAANTGSATGAADAGSAADPADMGSAAGAADAGSGAGAVNTESVTGAAGDGVSDAPYGTYHSGMGTGDAQMTGEPGMGAGFGGSDPNQTPGSSGPAGPDGPHDFDDDEPKFDTQTGEPLDKPKKKFPAIVLTVAVSALALGTFIYALNPNGLPSKNDKAEEDPVETETVLAIASDETERSAKDETEAAPQETEAARQVLQAASDMTEAAQTETETQTKAESGAKDSKSPQLVLSDDAKMAMAESETEEQTESETETESESETGKGLPQFKTEGVTVSASLDVSDMVEEVMPQIVSVTATSIQTVRDFFYGTQQFEQTGAGSGIIVDKDDTGVYIVTDAFLLDGAEDVTVGFCVQKDLTEDLSDEDTISPATLLGYDRDTGLALLKVSSEDINETVLSLIKPAKLGDSDSLRVGERAIAIGNAMGRGLSVTQGIISAVDRPVEYAGGVYDFIQTDASINYGNYGGALLNQDGEVVGINAGKITDNSSEGMGYAFPINVAKDAIGRMLPGGESSVLGDTVKDEDASAEVKRSQEETKKQDKEEKEQRETLAIAADEDETSGEESEVSSEAESEKEPKSDKKDKKEAVIEAAPQTEETKESAGETEAVTQAETEADTEAAGKTSGKGQLGVQVGEYGKEDQIVYRIPAGAVIASVVEGSGAAQAGLAPGDIITMIDDSTIETVKDLQAALSDKKPGDKVDVSYVSPDESGAYDKNNIKTVTVTLG